jgi:heparan-sulfate lyase
MNTELGKQVYADGGHYELCPHYHLASINIFIKALNVAALNGFRNEFPQSYIDTIEKMITTGLSVFGSQDEKSAKGGTAQ